MPPTVTEFNDVPLQIKPLNFTWTEDRVRQLDALVARSRDRQENLSAKQIAREMGITKNMVIGRCYRTSLTLPRALHPQKRFVPTANPFAAIDNGCLWPQGHPNEPGFHFCGAPKHPGRPYCPAHCSVSYIMPNEEVRDAAE